MSGPRHQDEASIVTPAVLSLQSYPGLFGFWNIAEIAGGVKLLGFQQLLCPFKMKACCDINDINLAVGVVNELQITTVKHAKEIRSAQLVEVHRFGEAHLVKEARQKLLTEVRLDGVGVPQPTRCERPDLDRTYVILGLLHVKTSQHAGQLVLPTLRAPA